jgi:hypothetical protein
LVQEAIARSVITQRSFGAVRVAIQLDDQFGTVRSEISKVRANRNLAAEMLVGKALA